MQAWGEGGYSDDLTVASQCTEQGLDIYCPGYSIFPQWSVSVSLCVCLSYCQSDRPTERIDRAFMWCK